VRLLAIVILLAVLVSLVVPRRLRAIAWTLAIAAGVVPWTDYQGHPHWAQVGWLPFISPPLRLRDLAVNLVLYLPLGWNLVAVHRRSVATAVSLGVLLSLATEFTQVYSHRRFAMMTDVVMNGLGTFVGALVAAWWGRGRGAPGA
jgi:hypothetical protein